MKNWKIQWEEIVIESLKSNGIRYEKTSFTISPDMKKGRDNDWEGTINSGMVVDLKRKGADLILQGISQNSIPVNLGFVEFYDQDIIYKKGIICQLLEKDLNYAKGSKRTCLEFTQPIILIESDDIPNEILSSSTLRIKQQANKSGCFAGILFMFLILSAFLKWHLSSF